MVDVLVGTSFLNKHVLSIQYTKQQGRLRSLTIPILGTNTGAYSHRIRNELTEEEEEEGVVQDRNPTNPRLPKRKFCDRQTDCIHLPKGVTLEQSTQKSVRLSGNASGLVFIKPLANFQQRCQVRVANSLPEVIKDKPFDILISKFNVVVLICDHYFLLIFACITQPWASLSEALSTN